MLCMAIFRIFEIEQSKRLAFGLFFCYNGEKFFGGIDMRTGKIFRKTRETQVEVEINLDGEGKATVATGIGFFNHMLNLFAAHGQVDLKVESVGDLEIDGHHSVEDIGIAIGAALKNALGDKKSITRYGTFFLPMDESLALVSIDISGRPYLVYEVGNLAPMIGSLDTELVEEFLRAFAFNAGITLHIKILYGKNSHHKVEAIFKALGRALRIAVSHDEKVSGIPSTKGVL